MGPEWGKIRGREIAQAINGILVAGKNDPRVRGISTDSRTIEQGQIFWALRGQRFDGHDYVKEALRAGACAMVISRDDVAREYSEADFPVIYVRDTLEALGDFARWWRKGHSATVAGITGSAGKTTTKEMTSLIFGLRHQVLKTKGNLNNLIGLPMTLLGLEGQHGRAVVEMGMNRPGEIARLTQIADPDLGLITNVGEAHLEGLGDLLGVARAKLEMAYCLRKDALLILNGDIPVLMECARGIKREFLTFGLRPENHFRAMDIDITRGGTEFMLFFEGKTKKISLGVPGIHNVMNALAASAIALSLGESIEVVSKGLEQFEGIEGRFSINELPDGITLIDDTYNANPLSLQAAVNSLKKIVTKPGSLIVGLGDMLELGDHDKQLHLDAGKLISELQPKLLIITGGLADKVAEGAMESGMSKGQVVVTKEIEEMSAAIRENVRPGDFIFLKGSRRLQLNRVVQELLAN